VLTIAQARGSPTQRFRQIHLGQDFCLDFRQVGQIFAKAVACSMVSACARALLTVCTAPGGRGARTLRAASLTTAFETPARMDVAS